MKGKSNCLSRILYIAKADFKNEIQIKTFSDILRQEICHSRSALREGQTESDSEKSQGERNEGH